MDRELISQRAATFLNLRRLPASLDVDQTAVILGINRDLVTVVNFDLRANSRHSRFRRLTTTDCRPGRRESRTRSKASNYDLN